MRWAAVRHEKNIQLSIVVDVSVCGAPRDFRSCECVPQFICYFLEFAIAEIAKKMRWLSVTDALLHALNLVFDVTVSYENVLPPIIVIVKKETAEAKCHQRGAPDFRARSFVHEQAVAFVVVKRKHLIGKVRDDQTDAAGA